MKSLHDYRGELRAARKRARRTYRRVTEGYRYPCRVTTETVSTSREWQRKLEALQAARERQLDKRIKHLQALAEEASGGSRHG